VVYCPKRQPACAFSILSKREIPHVRRSPDVASQMSVSHKLCLGRAVVLCVIVVLIVVYLRGPELANRGIVSPVSDDPFQQVLFNLTQSFCGDVAVSANASAVRLLFIGDSQSRHLFSQLATFLHTHLHCWWDGAQRPPPPLPPSTRFAFSWVIHMWPPVWFFEAANATPRFLIGFIASEYASNERWIRNAARAFGPTHLVVGRGCWDMIRRMPGHDRISTMCNEYTSSITTLVATLPSLRTLFLFPHLRVQFSRIHGASSRDVQRRDSPWTGCLIDRYQAFFREGLRRCSFGAIGELGRTHPVLDVMLLEADHETSIKENAPADGIHYDAFPVVQRLLFTLLRGMEPMRRHGGSSGLHVFVDSNSATSSLRHAMRSLDDAFDEHMLFDKTCQRAAASYRDTVRQLIHNETTALTLSHREIPSNVDLDTSDAVVMDEYLRCITLRYGLLRYLGPWPWSDDVATVLNFGLKHNGRNVTTVCNQRFDDVRSRSQIRAAAIRILTEEHLGGSAARCKVPVMALLDIRDTIGTKYPAGIWLYSQKPLHEMNCLNEPFGGRP
jgi:hypothetical protein